MFNRNPSATDARIGRRKSVNLGSSLKAPRGGVCCRGERGSGGGEWMVEEEEEEGDHEII